MTAKDLPATRETIGSYDLVEKIAEGGMGTVYKGRHWETGQIVAIKVLSKEIARNPVVLKRFEQEFRVASKIDHANVVKAIEYCGAGEAPYIVMEFVDGQSLGNRLENGGKMSEDDALFIILQAAHGLHRAHGLGVIHRDIKPDNILITSENKAKITDLGLAKDTDANENLTRAGGGLGTPNYMAPEQFRNAKNASVRCDVYGLGATLYHMVTGELPFGVADPVQSMMRKLRNELPTPKSLVPGLSERVDWAIRRAMSADPEARPASCREFVEDLTGQSTRMDDEGEAPAGEPGFWYLVYNDKYGMTNTTVGSTEELRTALKAGEYGDLEMVTVSMADKGPFVPLHTFAEFRDLVVRPGHGPSLSPMSAANLAKRGRLNESATQQTVIDTPAPSPEPTAELPPPPAREPEAESPADHDPDPESRREPLHLKLRRGKNKKLRRKAQTHEGIKLVLIMIVAVATAILAAKYLMPLLPPLR